DHGGRPVNIGCDKIDANTPAPRTQCYLGAQKKARGRTIRGPCAGRSLAGELERFEELVGVVGQSHVLRPRDDQLVQAVAYDVELGAVDAKNRHFDLELAAGVRVVELDLLIRARHELAL